MADIEETAIPVVAVSEMAEQVLDQSSPSPSPSPSAMADTPVEDEEEDVKVDGQDPPSFQERMDGVRDSFRETYQTFTSTKGGAQDAKTELDKAQVVYDGKVAEVSDARTDNLESTRGYIRILQEHEATLVGEGQG